MRWLIVLQALSAIAYYATAPFGLTGWIWLTLTVNTAALIFLWQTCRDTTSPAFRTARSTFTVSVILLELVIGLTDSPISTTALQGVINDIEVLTTGILPGVLWHDRLIGATRNKATT